MAQHRMTDQEATDEALLLFTRKMRRMAPEAFGKAWGQLPDGAQRALLSAEVRADALRNRTDGATYPEVEEEEPEDGEE